MNFRYPNITAGSPAEQIHQLKGFLYNLVEQLNLQESGGNSPRPAGPPLPRREFVLWNLNSIKKTPANPVGIL